MIILCTLLLAFLISLAAVLVEIIFKPHWAWLRRVIVAMLVLSVTCGIAAGIVIGGSHGEINRLAAEHNKLTLYQTVVEQTDNEYVRFDFYQSVAEYNKKYENAVDKAQSIWFGALYPKNWAEQIAPIEFYLHDGMYAG